MPFDWSIPEHAAHAHDDYGAYHMDHRTHSLLPHRHSTHFWFGSEATNSGLLSLKKAMVEFAHAHHTSRNVPTTKPLANAINATRKAIDHLEGDADFSVQQEREFYGHKGVPPNDPATQSYVINGNPDFMNKQ